MAAPGGTDQPSERASNTTPTLAAVAAEAGVSRSTVSRVVNHAANVRPEIAEAVRAAIVRLNYLPVRTRGMAAHPAYAVGLLVPEEITRFFGDPYLAQIVQGITARLDRSEYLLNLLVAGVDGEAKIDRFLRGDRIDGLLVISHHPDHVGLVRVNASIPVVFGGRPAVRGLGACYYVDVDNVHGARAATRHLIARGCRRIGTITGPQDMASSVDRMVGWQQALSDAGQAPGPVVHGDFTVLGGAAGMIELLDHQPDLDGVFVANDLMARGALSVLSRRRISVPDEVAVVGYDDGPAAVGEQPRLTTVRQPGSSVGAAMASMLLDLIAGRPLPSPARILPTELIVRETA